MRMEALTIRICSRRQSKTPTQLTVCALSLEATNEKAFCKVANAMQSKAKQITLKMDSIHFDGCLSLIPSLADVIMC